MCKLHQENKIIGMCYNSSCSLGPLYCIDCQTLDHSNHLQDTTNISDLEIRLEQFILSMLIDSRIKGISNSISEIQEIFKDIRIQTQQLNEKSYQSINLNDLNEIIEQSELSADFEKNYQQNSNELIIQQQIQCVQCKNILEQCEIKNDVQDNICKSCQGLKCYNCQQFFNQPLQKIENEIYCQDCIKCHECNKQRPRQMSGSFLYHEDCLKISQNSVLKQEMIAYIKKYIGTKQKKGDNGEKKIIFQPESYPFINLKDYLGYIIGYNHPIIKSKVPIDPKTYKITQEQADKYLNEDLDQFEKELYEFYLRQGKKLEDIPENIRMLMLFVLFIFKDFESVFHLANQQTYNHLFTEINKIQYPNIKDVQLLRGKVQKALDFFNDHFHREDGRVREKTIFNQLKKVLPKKQRE